MNARSPLPGVAAWLQAPQTISLSSTDLDLWLARIEDLGDGVAGLLSEAERERGLRFRHPGARREFLRTRGWLRQALARYLQAEPGQLQFAYGPQGKPRLAGSTEGQGICFNVSHSHGLALLAVTSDRLVGVDVEQIRTDKDLLGLANRYFSANEIAALGRLPASEAGRAFFLAWTRKEAFIKALGHGMSFPLDQFDVSLAPGERAVLLEVRSQQTNAREWAMTDIDLGTEFAGAAVVHGGFDQIRLWQMQ